MDEMTVERVEELTEYWREYPPPHLLVRAAIGYRKDPENDDEPPPPGAL